MTEDDLEILSDFVTESIETLDSAEPILIDLDTIEGKEIHTAVDTIFRAFHSMKGAAGYLQQQNIQRLTHMAETVLQEIRKNPELGSQCSDTLIESCDVVRQMLTQITTEYHDNGFDEDIDRLIQEMKNLLEEQGSSILVPEKPPEPEPVAVAEPAATEPKMTIAELDQLFETSGSSETVSPVDTISEKK